MTAENGHDALSKIASADVVLTDYSAVALEDIGDRAAGRPGLARVALEETLTDLARPPSEALVLLEDEFDEFGRGGTRRTHRRAAAVEKAGVASLAVSLDPLVASDTADTVAQAQLAHAPVAASDVLQEMSPLKHGVGLLPWHRASSRKGESTVNHVPGHL